MNERPVNSTWHDLLAGYDQLRHSNRFRDAQAGYLHILDQVASEPSTGTARTAVVAAAQRAMAVALDSQDVESSLDEVGNSLRKSLRDPRWREAQHRIAEHLTRVVNFEQTSGAGSNALELFELARRLKGRSVEENRRFALLAMHLGRRTLDAAELYLEFLEAGGVSEEERQPALALLRDILWVDLQTPEDAQLALMGRLCQRAWDVAHVPWAAAAGALVELRANRIKEALAIRDRVVDLAGCDARTVTALAMVAYRGRRWTDALQLLDLCNPTALTSAGPFEQLAKPLRAMARINLMLFSKDGPANEWVQQLDEDLTALADNPLAPPYALDAAWVMGAGRSLQNDHPAALQAFTFAPLEGIAWRFAELEADSSAAQGQHEIFRDRSQQWAAAPHIPAALVPLLQARESLAFGRVGDAEEQLAAAQGALRPEDEADLHVVCRALAVELATRRCQPGDSAAELDETILAGASLPALARLDRARALRLIERGAGDDVTAARLLLASNRQTLTAPLELHRAQMTLLGLHGVIIEGPAVVDDQAVGEGLTSAVQQQDATPLDRLARALWLANQPQLHGLAVAAVAEVKAELPDSLEVSLAEYQLHCAAARAAGETPTLKAPSEWQSEAVWLQTPRLSLYRPWYGRVPVPDWQRAFQLSPHRIADMLFAADLLLEGQQVNDAVRIMDMIRQALGPQASVLADQLALRFRRAALWQFQQAQFAEACELHDQALSLAGGEAESAERPFAVEVAEALANFEATPPDPVLKVLAGWLENWTDAPEGLDETPVGQALQRFLLVDDATPGEMATVRRRRDWSQRIATLQPRWAWPQRNLAWAAIRHAEWTVALEHLARIETQRGIDHFLRGHALWQMRNFSKAEQAFGDAMVNEEAFPEASAWQAVSNAAAELARPVSSSPQLAGDIADRLLETLDDREAPLELQEITRLWRVAVLLAADRGGEAANCCAQIAVSPERAEQALLLRGLAQIQQGRIDQALVLWGDEAAADAKSLKFQAVRLWAVFRLGVRAARTQALEQLANLRRLGANHAAFTLCEATQHLVFDRAEQALALLQASRAAEDDSILRPLEVWLAADRDWLIARAFLAQGDPTAAERQLEQVQGPRIALEQMRLVQASIFDATGRSSQAEQQLERLVADSPLNHEFLARLTFLRARQGSVEDAQIRLRQLQDVAPDHPVFFLAQAELAQRADNVPAARDALATAWKTRPPFGDAREAALAAAKLARIAEQSQDPGEAEKFWSSAAELAPLWPVPIRRLALLQVVRAADQDAHQKAVELIDSAISRGGDDLSLRLAKAVALVGCRQMVPAAQLLAGTINSSKLALLPLAAQRALLEWCVEIQAAAGCFGAAADVIEKLQHLVPENAQALLPQLDRLQLLQVQRILCERPLNAAMLLEGQARAEKVIARSPDDAVANLLATLCCVLQRKGDVPETIQLAERLSTLPIPSGPPAVLAVLLQQLVGVAAESQLTIDESELSPSLRLVVANQRRELAPLVLHACELAAAAGDNDIESPFAAGSLFHLAALDHLHHDREQTAFDILEKCPKEQRTAEIRLLWAKLLARRGASALRAEDFERTQTLLTTANAVLAEPEVGEPGVAP